MPVCAPVEIAIRDARSKIFEQTAVSIALAQEPALLTRCTIQPNSPEAEAAPGELPVADSPRAEVNRSDWRQIGTPSGFGFNYIMFNNRRQIVDERIINEDGETEITGNTQVALHPFNLKQVTVRKHPDCTVCWEEDP